MNGNSAAAMRPTGVVIPPSQGRKTAPGAPGEVTAFAEAKTYGIKYIDQDGQEHTSIVMFIGGQWYMPPNGENYAATLRPISPTGALGKALEERRLGENTSTLPKEDAVDVIG